LRATIGWSLNLLDDEERRLFAELAVFAGGWTLEAAEIVCHADIETLAALVDKSLIRRIDDRYSMLTTIRTYMRERLDETGLADGVMRALCQYLLALVREGTGSLRETAPTAELTQRLRLELDNVRAATEWALGAAEVELATVLAIESVWFGAGFGPEKRRFLHEAVNGQSLVRPNIRARALYFSGICAWDAREVAEAEGRFEEGLHLFRQLDDDKWIGRTMLMKGVTAAWRREYGQAKSCFDESLRLARETRDDQGIYQALHSLGELARKLGDIEEAEALLSQSEDAAVQAGGSWGIAFILHSRGDIALARLDLVSATRYYADALRLEADASQRPTRGILYCLGGLAAVAAMAGQLERAGRLWGAVLALQHHSDAELLSEDRRMYEENLSRSFAASDAWNDSVRTGRAMSLEQAIGYAFGPTGHRS
jgi:predicted ATPase